MSDIESLRQEAESLKNQIRVCIRRRRSPRNGSIHLCSLFRMLEKQRVMLLSSK